MVKYENPGGHAIVQLDFSLTYNSQRAYQQITRGLKTSIGRVTAATFDDNLFPGINSYNQGNPPAQGYNLGDSALRWKNLWVSGLLNVGRLTVDPGSAENGAIYYNTTDNAFRGYRNDAWTNLGIGWATSSANLYNTNSGNVGIGTAVLSYPFEVAKDGSVASGNWVNVASIRIAPGIKDLVSATTVPVKQRLSPHFPLQLLVIWLSGLTIVLLGEKGSELPERATSASGRRVRDKN